MTVVTTAVTTLKPGRFEDYVEKVARPAKAVDEKIGIKNVRLLAGLVAGEATGTLVWVQEADDFAAAGAQTDRAMADPVIQKLMALGNDSPIAGYQISQWIEIPL
jgi:hypothetical protein